jgi:hypothetical protein
VLKNDLALASFYFFCVFFAKKNGAFFGSATCNEKLYLLGRPAALFTTPAVFVKKMRFMQNFRENPAHKKMAEVHPHLGQSLCCTSSFTDCTSFNFTNAVLGCTTAATRTQKIILARSSGLEAREVALTNATRMATAR